MKKMNSLVELNPSVKLICWDLDGTLFDTETMWFNMNKLVTEKYGKELSQEEFDKASEEIAANAYKTWGYRANADKVLNYFKENNVYQVVINRCDLTNKTILKNEAVNNTFSFDKFNGIVSEGAFKDKFTTEDMYARALEIVKVTNKNQVVVICDMPFELKAAKDGGFITIWAKNKAYPFTEDELKTIEEVADYYVEDFLDLIK